MPGERYKILLGVPSSGHVWEPSGEASWLSSCHHDVERVPSCLSGPNFNNCWTTGLNAGKSGKFTHYAMMHTDIRLLPCGNGLRWLDVLAQEMDRTGCDLITVPCSIKDQRAITSHGVGKFAGNRWYGLHRRFSTCELDEELPETFGLADTGYNSDEFYLGHNFPLALFDLRKPIWYRQNSDGTSPFVFNFEERIEWIGGVAVKFTDSEDWAMSRILGQHGCNSRVTTRIKLKHQGVVEFPNYGDWGDRRHDTDTLANWQNDPPLPGGRAARDADPAGSEILK